MNCWRFDDRIFDACRDVPRSARGEFELPEAVRLALARVMRFRVVRARGPMLDLSRPGGVDVEPAETPNAQNLELWALNLERRLLEDQERPF